MSVNMTWINYLCRARCLFGHTSPLHCVRFAPAITTRPHQSHSRPSTGTSAGQGRAHSPRSGSLDGRYRAPVTLRARRDHAHILAIPSCMHGCQNHDLVNHTVVDDVGIISDNEPPHVFLVGGSTRVGPLFQ